MIFTRANTLDEALDEERDELLLVLAEEREHIFGALREAGGVGQQEAPVWASPGRP